MVGESLQDAVESSGQRMLEPFGEVIVITTLCWRSVTLKRLSGSPAQTQAQGWSRYSWLYDGLQKRLALLSLPSSSASLLLDPMRLFANILANAAIIWLYDTMEKDGSGLMDERMFVVPLHSACEIAGLTGPLAQCSLFKVRNIFYGYYLPQPGGGGGGSCLFLLPPISSLFPLHARTLFSVSCVVLFFSFFFPLSFLTSTDSHQPPNSRLLTV